MFGRLDKTRMPSPEQALPGRDTAMPVSNRHFVNGHPIQPPFPKGMQQALFGMGCFWGAERRFWELDGVYSTAVGYAGGFTPNPTYQEVCSGGTGHAEVVRVTFDPERVTYGDLLEVFWKIHDPTQVNRQGPDVGYQYRSVVFFHSPAQEKAAVESKKALEESGKYSRPIATSIEPAAKFWKAEEYHQQYLEKKGLASCHISLQ